MSGVGGANPHSDSCLEYTPGAPIPALRPGLAWDPNSKEYAYSVETYGPLCFMHSNPVELLLMSPTTNIKPYFSFPL